MKLVEIKVTDHKHNDIDIYLNPDYLITIEKYNGYYLKLNILNYPSVYFKGSLDDLYKILNNKEKEFNQTLKNILE